MKRTFKSRGWWGTVVLALSPVCWSPQARGGIDICALAPNGLASWWPGNGSASDVVNTNDGVLQGGAGYSQAVVGLGFDLSGNGQFVQIPNSASLNPPGSFSVEGWIIPRQDGNQTLFSKWGDAGEQSFLFSTKPGRALSFAIADSANQGNPTFQNFSTTNGVLTLNSSNHVAATYDQPSGIRRIYVNAVLIAQHTNAPNPVKATTVDVGIGATVNSNGTAQDYFNGIIDEWSYYSRTLSDSEIRNLHDANFGKCPLPPSIIVQPASSFINEGSPATFSVTARGTPALTYQWRKNGLEISGATASSFSILNALYPDSGAYTAIVRNTQGSVTSIVATLAVNRFPIALDVPAMTIANQSCSIPVHKLELSATDPDGDPVTFNSVSTGSTNGGTIIVNGQFITYTPVSNYLGQDRFTYSIRDSHGATASAYILVNVISAGLPSKNMFQPAAVQGGLEVRFAGLPLRIYHLQRSTSTQGPWSELASVQADAKGIGIFVDTNAPPGGAFYRTVYP